MSSFKDIRKKELEGNMVCNVCGIETKNNSGIDGYMLCLNCSGDFIV